MKRLFSRDAFEVGAVLIVGYIRQLIELRSCDKLCHKD